MWECFKCGNRSVVWSSDFDAEDCGYEQAGIVSYYTCSKCGSEYEVFEPLENDEEEN